MALRMLQASAMCNISSMITDSSREAMLWFLPGFIE